MRVLKLVLLVLVVLSAGCMSESDGVDTHPSPEELCKRSAMEYSVEYLDTNEVFSRVVGVGTFSSFENAQTFMRGYGIKDSQIIESKNDFIGGKHPVVIMELVSNLGETLGHSYGVVCDIEGNEVISGGV